MVMSLEEHKKKIQWDGSDISEDHQSESEHDTASTTAVEDLWDQESLSEKNWIVEKDG